MVEMEQLPCHMNHKMNKYISLLEEAGNHELRGETTEAVSCLRRAIRYINNDPNSSGERYHINVWIERLEGNNEEFDLE